MSPEDRVLVHYRLDFAEETLDAARMMLDAGYLRSATNRIYYACFYAVSGLLLTAGKTSKRHSGIRDMFNIEYIRTGLIPSEYGKFYGRMFDFRQEGDYEDLTEFSAESVHEWFEQAERFVARVSKLAKERLEKP